MEDGNMKRVIAVLSVLAIGAVVGACNNSSSGSAGSAGSGGSAASTPAAAGGDSVGDPTCDDILKRAAAPGCKDKPGIAAITANRDNWKAGLSNSMTKDTIVQTCKSMADTLKAAGCP
jgi:hypothetical protein